MPVGEGLAEGVAVEEAEAISGVEVSCGTATATEVTAIALPAANTLSTVGIEN